MLITIANILRFLRIATLTLLFKLTKEISLTVGLNFCLPIALVLAEVAFFAFLWFY